MRKIVQGWSPVLRAYMALVAFSIMGSLMSKLTGLDPGLIKPIAGALTLAFGVAAVTQPLLDQVPKWILGLVLVIGAGSEIAGLYTGHPFGEYVYTDQWQPVIQFADGKYFPILLPFAWIMMAAGGYHVALRLGAKSNAIWLGALIATMADVLMEPAATGPLAYWKWLNPNAPYLWAAPVQNSIGWFVVCLVAGAVLWRAGAREAGKLPNEPGIVIGVHVAFMLFLYALG